jgi:hypothetical protein
LNIQKKGRQLCATYLSKFIMSLNFVDPQVNMPSEKAVSRGMTILEYRENQLAVFLT